VFEQIMGHSAAHAAPSQHEGYLIFDRGVAAGVSRRNLLIDEQAAAIPCRQAEFQDAQPAAVKRFVVAGEMDADWRIPRNCR
jgi:hypothetical protein